uniref:Uncharacterized protein n=1 Tax=Aplanochytrium stocchinoi TaxID=215587 RepID=A0A7S3V1E5_9STRA|mmetsp:Transcript_10607/g.13301  ORF Transcript_10607/g.13301 Transcript_10607/m.13301 type:complete len:209 (+) Transcript_10607:447-1073(+)|eukprot:CAMPEP_0204835084 /NCGR_PEP_ID=MMETSP1346-20131115/21563_1 /ASSEMBLY_ACC=CAM_ASM_000771 /TAXON_ID=215587 /ORGANISM="Aplanochytrium stocchinoi, Strain GSBS06" /LENGTH=208 /DNA_ID=CAMNT_0051968791 /DNA_START=392 /DNA_END=1018 /DNA_ORIENTATION=+
MEAKTRKRGVDILNGELSACRIGVTPGVQSFRPSRNRNKHGSLGDERDEQEVTIKPYKIVSTRRKSELDLLDEKSKGCQRSSNPGPLEALWRKRSSSMSPNPKVERVIFEEGESVESMLKKFEQLNTLSEEKFGFEELKRDKASFEKRRQEEYSQRYSQQSSPFNRKKLKHVASTRRIVKGDDCTEHNYSYKPGFFSKKLLFLNKAFS